MADKVADDRGALETKSEDLAKAADQVYSDAWDQANKETGETDKADLSAADDPAKAVEETPPPTITPSPSTPPLADAIVQQPGESDEKYEQRYKTLQGIHKHDRESWETEKAILLTQLEEAKKPKTPAAPAASTISETTPEKKAAAEAFIDSLTPEQQDELKVYEQDFDVVSKMEGIKRSVELAKLRKEMQAWKEDLTSQLDQTRTQFTSQIAPAIALAEDNERESHFNVIREGYTREDGTAVPGHGDFETYRDDGSLLKWIESKPRYLQPALKQTYEKGTAQDVVDLFTDFKRDSNITQTPEPSDNVIPISPTKAARKQALTTVTTRRGAINTGSAVASDYESAWDEANAKQGG